MDDPTIPLLQVIAGQSETITKLQLAVQEQRDINIGALEAHGKAKAEIVRLVELMGGKDAVDKAKGLVTKLEAEVERLKAVSVDNDELARLYVLEETFESLQPLFEEMLVAVLGMARPITPSIICGIPIVAVRDVGEVIYGLRG